MKNLLIGVVLILVVVAGVAYWQGWFKFEKTIDTAGKTHIGVTVDKEKFKKSKDSFVKSSGEKFKNLKTKLEDKIASLRSKSKDLKGDAKAKAEKEIQDAEALAKKHKDAEAKLKAAEEAGEDKFEDVKKDLEKTLDELSKGSDKPE
jgi:hypothetical protein